VQEVGSKDENETNHLYQIGGATIDRRKEGRMGVSMEEEVRGETKGEYGKDDQHVLFN